MIAFPLFIMVCLVVLAWLANGICRDKRAMEFALVILKSYPSSGRGLKQYLDDAGYRMSSVAFYALMTYLEQRNLVARFTKEKEVDGQKITETWFRTLV